MSPSTDPLYIAGDLALLAGGPAIILFVLLYALRSKWEATTAGRTIMALAASLAMLYLFIAFVLWFEPGMQVRGWLRLAVYVFASGAMWGMTASLIRYQHRGRHSRRD